MAQIIEENELKELLELAKPSASTGTVASYIPALKQANAEDLGIALYTTDNKSLAAGNVTTPFTLQSISKVISLALALMDRGSEYVFSKVGMEPTGDPFNSIIKLETTNPSKPLNPMINAGALAVTSMIIGTNNEEKLKRILQFVRNLTGNQSLSYSTEVADSEFATAHLNRSLCYYMKQNNIIEGNVEDLIELYTKQCAILVNCRDLARIGLIFATDGYDPYTEQQLIPSPIAKICKTFMITCGMYNSSGEFAIRVGIPAKSGVAGGILACVKNQVGIGVYGPALDEKGNSVAGVKLLEMLSKKMDWSMF